MTIQRRFYIRACCIPTKVRINSKGIFTIRRKISYNETSIILYIINPDHFSPKNIRNLFKNSRKKKRIEIIYSNLIYSKSKIPLFRENGKTESRGRYPRRPRVARVHLLFSFRRGQSLGGLDPTNFILSAGNFLHESVNGKLRERREGKGREEIRRRLLLALRTMQRKEREREDYHPGVISRARKNFFTIL